MTSATQSDERQVRVTAREDGPVAHTLEIEVEVARVRTAFDRAYRDLAKRVRVKGFRPGKAPRSVLERLYGPSITEQLEHTLVAETLVDAIEQTGLRPVTEPAIDAGRPVAGEVFRYTARIEVKPQVAPPDPSTLTGRRTAVRVEDDDVDAELEDLRNRTAPVLEEPEGTAAAEGHVLSVDFVGRIDGRTFEGGTGRGVQLEIGAGRFLPGFDEGLVGAVAGEDRAVSLRFPDDYGNAELSGEEAVFDVHVVDVKRRHLRTLDDEFAKDLGDFESLEALRERIRGDLFASRERASRVMLHRSLMDGAIAQASFDVPAGLVEAQLERRIAAARRRLANSVPEEAMHRQVDAWREAWREPAEREVRERLLLEALAEAEGIEVDDAEVNARVEAMAEEQGVDAKTLRGAYGEDTLERILRAELLEEKSLDFLAAEAKVEETAAT
jgi:trigger factor